MSKNKKAKVGCHVSIAGGIENAPARARELTSDCFQMFSRSPRGGAHKEIGKPEAKTFLLACKENNFEIGRDYIIHTPYFINLASKNSRIYYGSISALRKELETASLLKSPFVITHIGSSKDLEGDNIQQQVNEKVLKGLRKVHENYSGTAILLLEIAAGSGNIIGDTFKEIGFFIKEMKKEKINIGFCLDTCHSFAAGYDLRTSKKVIKVFEEMDKEIGLESLGCIHFNDSQTKLDSHVDRHEHIGEGEIGKKGLEEVAKQAKKLGINIYLETKHDKIDRDLELTKKMIS